MSLPNNERRQQMVAFAVKFGLLLFWVGGVCESMRFCLLPSKGHPGGPEEFPLYAFGFLSGFITLQVLLLYAFLGPQDLSSHPRRWWVAFPVLMYFFILNYISLRMGYDGVTDYVTVWQSNFEGVSLFAIIIASIIFIPLRLFPRRSKQDSNSIN
jgi:hypothetical protein